MTHLIQRCLILTFLLSLALTACSQAETPASTPIQEASPSASASPTSSPEPSKSPTPAATRTLSPTETPTPQPSATPFPTSTSTATPETGKPGAVYLVHHLGQGKGEAVIPAPEIEGLALRSSADEETAGYIDSKGRVILTAGARRIVTAGSVPNLLELSLSMIYGQDSVYSQGKTYPHFRFNIDGVNSGFFGIDRVLSYNQIQQLYAALEQFTQPALAPLQKSLLADRFSYVVIDDLGFASGLHFGGSNVIWLDRQTLFGDKYLLAAVIAHEGSHALQNRAGASQSCAEHLGREIGEGKIPDSFLDWTAQQVLDGIKDRSIGAYHVSYWVSSQLGATRDMADHKSIIQTAKFEGYPLVDCQE
jgi:hypothetical protein